MNVLSNHQFDLTGIHSELLSKDSHAHVLYHLQVPSSLVQVLLEMVSSFTSF